MNVVGHQPVGQEADCEAPDGSCQLLEVSRVVLIITKDDLVIVPTDCHVVDGSVVGDSKWAWHTKGSDPFETSTVGVAHSPLGGVRDSRPRPRGCGRSRGAGGRTTWPGHWPEGRF